MRRARSVTGPLRRAHPASGATWNVQVVKGKMSTQCLWNACRALSAGLLLMLLGGAMAVIGYYAESLSVAEEIRGNATISVKDEARGFHLNNLSYAGPIVMGFGGFIVVAACVMTFEARDSAAKVTPARPTALAHPTATRRGAAPARLDTLGVYRLPHALPVPRALPAPLPAKSHRTHHRVENEKKSRVRFGSAPDLRSGSVRATTSVSALRRPLRRYALSVDEPPQSAVSASAAESDCGSQSSLALDLHASGACAAVTLRVRDNTRRRPLARQPRLSEDTHVDSPTAIKSIEESIKRNDEQQNQSVLEKEIEMIQQETKPFREPKYDQLSPPQSPRLIVTPCSMSPPLISNTSFDEASKSDTTILIEETDENDTIILIDGAEELDLLIEQPIDSEKSVSVQSVQINTHDDDNSKKNPHEAIQNDQNE